jgi:predicted nucleotidyltransferase
MTLSRATTEPAGPTPSRSPSQDTFLEVLDETMRALNDARVPFLLIGAIGSAVYGRDRGTDDIDLFVHPDDATRVIDVLRARGFETRREHEHWLFKAFKRDVLVDVIFRSSGDILLDDEMLARARTMTFRGRSVPVAPPEDLVVMKAVAASEDTPRYWYDAIAIVGQSDLDWDYLLARARRHGARRILSLLLFADSIDLLVPRGPIDELYDAMSQRRSA